MCKFTRTAGIIFLAASSVYSGPAALAESATSARIARAQAPSGVLNAASTSSTADALKAAAAAASDSAKAADTDPFAAATNPSSNSSKTDSSSASSSDDKKSSDVTPVADTDKPAPAGPPPKVTMTDVGTFSIQINNDISLVEVLRMIASQAQISVIPSKEVHGTVPAMDLYNVTVHEALDAILHTNGYVYREKGNFIYVYSQKELVELEKANRVTATDVFRVFYTPAANAVNMIKPVLSTDGQVSFSTPAVSGLDSGVKDTGGNTHATDDVIVVTDYPENLDRVRKVLKEIDRRPQQILIEATILSAALNEDNSLGVDFTILGGVDFQTLSGVGQSPASALSGQIISDKASGPIVDKGYNGGSTGFTQNVPQGGLRLGFVQNNIAIFLQALENVTDTTVLANPKVLALNKQKGEVIIGRQDGYITTTLTENSSTQTVEFLDTGTRLIFRPYIGDDGYIRMEIHPEDSSGGLTSANLPFKSTTEVTSNVMVKDGHTIVIGGLFRESSSTSRSQVPFLGNVPFAGPLFRSQGDHTTRQEIIILLTPHIVKDDSAYADASEAELKEAEKLRVGVRQGMMPWGRERLAETNYEWATAELNQPHPDLGKARFFLDSATNLNPHFIEAIDLKEKVTGQTVTQADNSTIRTFLQRQILAERNHSSPTTMPSVVPITEELLKPTLQSALLPTAQPALAETSTTRPAVADAPTTQPAVASTPTTQPDIAEAPTTQPTTQPAVADAATTQPGDTDNTVVELPADTSVAAPTTQPAETDADRPKNVTAVPVEVPDTTDGK
jgi:type IV pilus assembly protein PilQ